MGELNHAPQPGGLGHGAIYVPTASPQYGFDYIGFNPTANQAEEGTPRFSGWAQAVRATPPMMAVDLYPTFPYMGYLDFDAYQIYANSMTESLLAYTLGYRGMLPVELQPIANQPYPYQENTFLTGEVY